MKSFISYFNVLAVGQWFPPGTPVSSTRKLISSSFHRLDMTLAVAEALNPNKPRPFKMLRVPSMYTNPPSQSKQTIADRNQKYASTCQADSVMSAFSTDS